MASRCTIGSWCDVRERALEARVWLEACIVHAVSELKDGVFLSREDSTQYLLQKLHFYNRHGDLFSILDVVRNWTQVKPQNWADWCGAKGASHDSLLAIESFVEKERCCLSQRKKRHGMFNPCKTEADMQLSELLFDVYTGNTCEFTGHISTGYRRMRDDVTVRVADASQLHIGDIMPNYICYIKEPVARNGTLYVENVFVVEDSLVENSEILKLHPRPERLEPLTIYGLGLNSLAALSELWNKIIRHELCRELCCDVFAEADSSFGHFTIFALNKYHDVILKRVTDAVNELRRAASRDVNEMYYPDKESGLRLVMTAGYDVRELLSQASEPLSFDISLKRGADYTENEIKDLMALNEHLVHLKKLQGKDIWGQGRLGTTIQTIAIDAKVKQTVQFTRYTDDRTLKTDKVGTELHLEHVACGEIAKVTVTLTSTRQRTGKVTLIYNCADDASAVASCKAIKMGKRTLKLHHHNGDTMVYLSNVPQKMSYEQIEQFLVTKVKSTPTNIVFEKRNSATKVSECMDVLKQEVDRAVHRGEVSTAVQDSKISFEFENKYWDEVVGALNSLTLEDYTLTVCLDRMTYIKIHPKLWQISHNKVNIKVNNLMKKRQNIMVKVDTDADGFAELNIIAHSINVANMTVVELKSLFLPVPLDVEGNVSIEPLLDAPHVYLEKHLLSLHCYGVVVDNKIHIYGSQKCVANASKFLVDVITGATDERVYGVSLSELRINVAAGLQRLARVFGSNTQLLEKHGLRYVHYDVTTRRLEYMCTAETHQRVLDVLMGSPACPEASAPECAACFCDVRGRVVCLEACGCQYCVECIQTHVTVSMETKQFPVLCVNHACQQPMAIDDFLYVTGNKRSVLVDLARASLSTYLGAHVQQWIVCARADCPGAARIGDDETRPRCIVCNAKFCTQCRRLFHGELTCEEAKTREDALGELKDWFDGNARKLCPNCNMGIEKVDGCNRVSCVICKKHICWICDKVYDSMADCYTHLRQVHNGPY